MSAYKGHKDRLLFVERAVKCTHFGTDSFDKVAIMEESSMTRRKINQQKQIYSEIYNKIYKKSPPGEEKQSENKKYLHISEYYVETMGSFFFFFVIMGMGSHCEDEKREAHSKCTHREYQQRQSDEINGNK